MLQIPISILFAGDFIPPTNSDDSPFSQDLLKVLSNKDFSIVNLEAPLTISNEKILKTGKNFKSDPDAVQHIVNGKFDAVTLANNHIRDFGGEGVLDTLEACRKNNIMFVGAGESPEAAAAPLMTTIKGKRIAFFNFSEREFNIVDRGSPGANPFDAIDAFYQIQKAKSVCDFVFVIYHGGVEYHYLPIPTIVKRFKFMIDAGADCVVSHHTHRYSGMMYHKGKPVFFGLGNFLASTISTATDPWLKGIIVRLEITENRIDHQIIPTKMAPDFGSVDLMAGEDKQESLNHFEELSGQLADAKAIQSYWKDVYGSNTDRLTHLIKSDTRLEFRLRKQLPKIFKPELSQFKLMTLLNLFRCDAHREQVIQTLENRYKKLPTDG